MSQNLSQSTHISVCLSIVDNIFENIYMLYFFETIFLIKINRFIINTNDKFKFHSK